MSENTYWCRNGKYEKENSEIEKLVHCYGMTNNSYVNLYHTACNIYYDMYNNGGCNIDNMFGRIDKYIRPFADEINSKGAINFNVKDSTLRQYFKNENKLEKFMDNVISFVADKDLSFDKYMAYYKDDYVSYENHEGFKPIVFGFKEEMEDWMYARIHNCKCELV